MLLYYIQYAVVAIYPDLPASSGCNKASMPRVYSLHSHFLRTAGRSYTHFFRNMDPNMTIIYTFHM